MSRIHDALKKAERDREPVVNSADARATRLTGPVPALPEAVSSVVQTEEIAEQSLGPITLEALIERCPACPWNPDTNTVLFAESQNHTQGKEEYRTLRSRLYQIRERQPLQTLLVASALPSEGKTFTAVNLAQAIVQQQGRSVLLIDADLRASHMHRQLGAPLTPGLSDFLQGGADLFSILQRGPRENLVFIAGGTPPANAIELISTGRLKTLLQQLTPIFDWIILDSPPAVPVSDASLLAGLCDGVLMVVQSGSTPHDIAQKACHEFRDKQVIGVVLNRVPPGSGYDSYYYYRHPASGSRNEKNKG